MFNWVWVLGFSIPLGFGFSGLEKYSGLPGLDFYYFSHLEENIGCYMYYIHHTGLYLFTLQGVIISAKPEEEDASSGGRVAHLLLCVCMLAFYLFVEQHSSINYRQAQWDIVSL